MGLAGLSGTQGRAERGNNVTQRKADDVNLTEFLLARIAEDEAMARAAIGKRVDISAVWSDMEVSRHIERWSSARVLAECEARRRIVELHKQVRDSDDPANPETGCLVCDWDSDCQVVMPSQAPGCPTLQLLAAVYSSHPDYRSEWAP